MFIEDGVSVLGLLIGAALASWAVSRQSAGGWYVALAAGFLFGAGGAVGVALASPGHAPIAGFLLGSEPVATIASAISAAMASGFFIAMLTGSVFMIAALASRLLEDERERSTSTARLDALREAPAELAERPRGLPALGRTRSEPSSAAAR